MKHFLLKFNHGVEIGARLAYEGHLKRTGDQKINKIIEDEKDHQQILSEVLEYYGEQPSKVIDQAFSVVGGTVGKLCLVSPKFALNFVARSMELLAVVNYSYLSTIYPEFEHTFANMAKAELEHQEYFE